MSDQDNNFYLISLSILMTCLLDNVWRSCMLTTTGSLKVDQESSSLITAGSLAEIKLFTVIHVYTGRWKICNLN